MKKLLFGALFLFVIAGCATNQESTRLSFKDSLRATIDQCERAATGPISSALLQERPDFGFRNQVLSLEELVVGEVYIWCHVPYGIAFVYIVLDTELYYGTSFGETIPVLQVGVVDYYGDWNPARPTKVFLSDMGVVPYSNSRGETFWNPANAILRVQPGHIVEINP